jgi:hypothetical protein
VILYDITVLDIVTRYPFIYTYIRGFLAGGFLAADPNMPSRKYKRISIRFTRGPSRRQDFDSKKFPFQLPIENIHFQLK